MLDAVNEEGIAAIFSVPEWQSRVVFTIDRAFVYAITELVFGGDGSEPPFEEKRRFSQIEKNVAKAVLECRGAGRCSRRLRRCRTLTISFERIETNMETVSIDNRDSKAVVAKFDLRAGGPHGQAAAHHPAIRRALDARSAKCGSDDGGRRGRRSPAGSARCSRRSTTPR